MCKVGFCLLYISFFLALRQRAYFLPTLHTMYVCAIFLNFTKYNDNIKRNQFLFKTMAKESLLITSQVEEVIKRKKDPFTAKRIRKEKIPKSHRKTWRISEYIASSSHTWLNKQQTLIRTGNSVFIAFICYTYKTYMQQQISINQHT